MTRSKKNRNPGQPRKISKKKQAEQQAFIAAKAAAAMSAAKMPRPLSRPRPSAATSQPVLPDNEEGSHVNFGDDEDLLIEEENAEQENPKKENLEKGNAEKEELVNEITRPQPT